VDVSIGKLYESYNHILLSVGNPKVFVDAYGDDLLQPEFEGLMTEFGFAVAGSKSDAEYILAVKPMWDEITHPVEKIAGVQLLLDVEMRSIYNDQIIFSMVNDPKQAAAFRGNTWIRKRNIAATQATEQIQEGFHKKIQEWALGMSDGRPLRIVFDNYSSFYQKEFSGFEDLMENEAGVSNILSEVDSIKGIAVLDFVFLGEINDLYDNILQTHFNSLAPTKRPILIRRGNSELVFNLP